ncbi:IS5 family transposase [Pseudovibrio sp. Tun.PSC04-5.I4]|uniref:IS5 family transposase n=1 Tax=Pseudovibrio sp. Tun.PSC04-5.I4 TaxID=1798213 RepID=UPI0008874B4B|nr:IS5 family transposase [Pseudovibrio sp. Tun.PSC04-5.I4]SDR44956.1 Transposase DDE domain-containing protein [Pseudovibrio sp. Tun.PSC04-5.I4]
MKIHFMPFKANVDRQHKFAKAKYKVTNWSKYNESLRRRGDVTVWIEESVAKAWFAPENQRRGRPAKFSEFAIETCLQIRVVFGLALRQTQGFVRSVFHLMELVLPVPDFSTLSRRADGLKLSNPKPRTNSEPVELVIDSTGVKIFGAGEWQETKHGTRIKRRTWRKLHLGLDLNAGQIVCSELTEDTVADPTAVSDLLDQIEDTVATFLGDGAYDGTPVRQELADRFEGIEVIIPPPKTAIPGPQAATAPTACDRDILAIQKNGRMSWQKQTGYGRRSRGETLMGRFKQVIGTTLRSRKLNNQRTEAKLGVAVLNTMTALGRATFEKVSA